jgi:hypothetical protein
MLVKPNITTAPWIDVQHVDAADDSGRDTDQLAWTLAPQPLNAC